MDTIKVDTEKLLEFAKKMVDLKYEFGIMMKEISSIEDTLNSVRDVSTYNQKEQLYYIEEMGHSISKEFENFAEDLNYVSKEYQNAEEKIKNSIGSMTIGPMNIIANSIKNSIDIYMVGGTGLKKSGNLTDIGENKESYLKRSLNQVIYGNYTEDVTLLGTGAQIGTGLIGIDLPADIRDIGADFVNWKWSWGHLGQTGLDIAALFPVLGSLKYTDEVAKLAKLSDEAVDSVKGIENAGKIGEDAIGEIDDFKLTAKDIPTAKSGEFNNFFNSLTSDELDELWKDKKIRKKIERELRAPGGLHEWHLVARAPQFKNWGVSAEQIKDLRSVISDLKFENPSGKHGLLGSTKAHNELISIIESSNDYNSFKRRLNNWANYRLEGGLDSLPEGLRLK